MKTQDFLAIWVFQTDIYCLDSYAANLSLVNIIFCFLFCPRVQW
jgi:hypothetical protein